MKNNLSAGFTLIELIVGIVVLSISFSIMFTLIYPMSEKSAEQMHQVRAAALGQSLMNEILARDFDENSDRNGGLIRCGEPILYPTPNLNLCTAVNSLGSDGEASPAEYNDVDDYNSFDFDSASNALGQSYDNLYPGFQANITVCYRNFDSNSLIDCSNQIEISKRIVITVTTPQGFDVVFAFYKGNF